MVEVVCDTSFLIHIATKRIKNISNLEVEIGSIQFVVPQVVINELQKLKNESSKESIVTRTLDFIKDLKIIPIEGEFADKAIIDYVKTKQGIIGTLDKELKQNIKSLGGSVLSVSNDKIVLES